jgi:exportin-2 (importin alpha re-exporter)
MSGQVQQIAQLLQSSLHPSTNKQAEAALQEAEQKPNFSISLLQIVADGNNDRNLRLAAALCFKNFIRRNWADESGAYKLPLDEVNAIKTEIIGLMTTVPESIQSQLGEAISIIAESDFYLRWDTLVDVSRRPHSPHLQHH